MILAAQLGLDYLEKDRGFAAEGRGWIALLAGGLRVAIGHGNKDGSNTLPSGDDFDCIFTCNPEITEQVTGFPHLTNQFPGWEPGPCYYAIANSKSLGGPTIFFYDSGCKRAIGDKKFSTWEVMLSASIPL